MSTALNDQDFPNGVSSDDRLDVFASHYAGAAARTSAASPASPGPATPPRPNSLPADQAKRFAGALEEAQSLRAELQKRDREIARTRDVLGIARWLCSEIGGRIDDEDHETHAEILHHIHTLIGLI